MQDIREASFRLEVRASIGGRYELRLEVDLIDRGRKVTVQLQMRAHTHIYRRTLAARVAGSWLIKDACWPSGCLCNMDDYARGGRQIFRRMLLTFGESVRHPGATQHDSDLEACSMAYNGR